jgi:alkylation response protein AidB-like acyl-CoA dehydrogenase
MPEIREAVAKLCAGFPGAYWRALDREGRYPGEFVAALTQAGFLSVLIPEEFGGAGLPLSGAAAILEEIQRAGCNGAACHAQMYTMGTVLRHGSPDQKARYLPEIAAGRLRLQAFGVTEPTSGTDTAALKTTARRDGDAYSGQRPKDLDLAGRAFRPHAAARAHDAAGPGREAHRRALGVPRRHARGPRRRASPCVRSAR